MHLQMVNDSFIFIFQDCLFVHADHFPTVDSSVFILVFLRPLNHLEELAIIMSFNSPRIF